MLIFQPICFIDIGCKQKGQAVSKAAGLQKLSEVNYYYKKLFEKEFSYSCHSEKWYMPQLHQQTHFKKLHYNYKLTSVVCFIVMVLKIILGSKCLYQHVL